MKRSLIVVGPLPPPYHGVTVSTSFVLSNPKLRKAFEVRHVDTSDHRTARNVGSWDGRNVLLSILAVARLWRSLRGRPGVVYLPLSQSTPGFLRDALLIHVASSRRWRIAAHLRGSEFRDFYIHSPRLLQLATRRTLARLVSVAVMGERLRGVFEGLVPSNRIAVVPNGTPVPAADGIVRGEPMVLFLSNLRRRKGVVEAVEAARLVAREHKSATFLFVGEWEDDKLEEELRSRAAGMDARIRFLAPVTGAEKDRLVSSASVLLFPPTESEGHPRVVIEALAAGVPVVATDRGAIAETIVDGKSGFLLANPIPDQIADRLLLLLRDTELLSKMSAAARSRHRKCFTQEEADQRLADWLEEVAEA